MVKTRFINGFSIDDRTMIPNYQLPITNYQLPILIIPAAASRQTTVVLVPN
ncbi:MAG: hypothetical protein HC849_31760 [Oscillatoriales cyanobacterium RU_3_3]|nr:hypothetical protein [Microcoleus sp. SU_5_6]NJL69775.1 hypothetical protein [Microcoleus sp. SM1_3_4]NJM63686.1 hypothetical protein [Oscillatoriales cyanobacterium RU_3_3]NJR21138.1 hypothetical protein [Richelia sp. CSU_2_1]